MRLLPTVSIIFLSEGEKTTPFISPSVISGKLICLLLSGSNSDGVNGLKTVKSWGGTALIQDPESAQVDYMPMQAKLNVKIDHVLPIEAIAEFINLLS